METIQPIYRIESKITFEFAEDGYLDYATNKALKQLRKESGTEEVFYHYTFKYRDYEDKTILLEGSSIKENWFRATLPADDKHFEEAWQKLVELNTHLQLEQGEVTMHPDDWENNRKTIRVFIK